MKRFAMAVVLALAIAGGAWAERPVEFDYVIPYFTIEGWEENTLFSLVNASDDAAVVRVSFFGADDLPAAPSGSALFSVEYRATTSVSLRDFLCPDYGSCSLEGWIGIEQLSGATVLGDYIIVLGPDTTVSGQMEMQPQAGRYSFRYANPGGDSQFYDTEFIVWAPQADGQTVFAMNARNDLGMPVQMAIDIAGGFRPLATGRYDVGMLGLSENGFGVIEVNCPVPCKVWKVQAVQNGLDHFTEAHYLGEWLWE